MLKLNKRIRRVVKGYEKHNVTAPQPNTLYHDPKYVVKQTIGTRIVLTDGNKDHNKKGVFNGIMSCGNNKEVDNIPVKLSLDKAKTREKISAGPNYFEENKIVTFQ